MARSSSAPRARAAPTPAPAPTAAAPRAPPFLLDPSIMPVWLWLPNLIGYVRMGAFLAAAALPDRTSPLALRLLVLSIAADFFDGPCARHFNMCSQFGDLLDHVADHLTMAYLVYLTSSATPYGMLNNAASIACNLLIALPYMAWQGHYFKHATAANAITAAVESNNYWNMLSILWCGNQFLIPCIKLAYHAEHGLPVTASTELLDCVDALGLGVAIVYSLACLHAAFQVRPAA